MRKLSDLVQPNQKVSRWRKRLAHQLRFAERPNYPLHDTLELLAQYFPGLNTGPGQVLVDAGANEGYVTEALARDGATVIGFEPNPWAARRAAKRVRSFPNAHVVCAALGRRGGLRDLYFPSGYRRAPELYSGSASIMASNTDVSTDSGVTVWAISMAEVLASQDQIEFLKIDVEGAEQELWPAIRENVDKIRFLAMESHGRLADASYGEWLAGAKAFIEENGLQDRWRLDWP